MLKQYKFYNQKILQNQIDALAKVTPCTISDDEEQITNKPPVLHWTADPLEGEIQFIAQLNFPLSGPDDSSFREICRLLKPHFETSYEWTGGILLTSDPVRLHVQRFNDTQIELAARICVDELEGKFKKSTGKVCIREYLKVYKYFETVIFGLQEEVVDVGRMLKSIKV